MAYTSELLCLMSDFDTYKADVKWTNGVQGMEARVTIRHSFLDPTTGNPFTVSATDSNVFRAMKVAMEKYNAVL